MRGKFLLLFAVVMKTWGLLIILTELLMCRRQGEERYFTTGQAGVIGMYLPFLSFSIQMYNYTIIFFQFSLPTSTQKTCFPYLKMFHFW